VLFQDGRGFVVEALEDGAQASHDEDGKDFFVGTKNGGGTFCLHGFSVLDEIGVIVIEDEELGVALAAGERETAGLVGEDIACGVNAGGVAEMGVFASWERSGEKKVF
jgi:hypothetical protein